MTDSRQRRDDVGEMALLGRRLRAARERLGWTREVLAFHSGVSWSAIAQVESGRRSQVRPSTLAALSRALGLSIDYLVNGRPSRPAMLEHSLFAYGTDDGFATVMGSFLAEGLRRSEAVLAVTTTANRELLRDQLGPDAQTIEFVDVNAFYATPLAALETAKVFADDRLARGASWVRFLGEPVWAEKTAADIRLWTRYESIFNLVFAAAPMTVVCPYDERTVDPEIIRAAHRTHPHARDEHGLATSPDYADPREFALS